MAKNRLTGSEIIVASCEEAGMEKEEDISFYTICVTHSSLVGHRTKTLALSHSRVPDWCQECQAIMEAKGFYK